MRRLEEGGTIFFDNNKNKDMKDLPGGRTVPATGFRTPYPTFNTLAATQPACNPKEHRFMRHVTTLMLVLLTLSGLALAEDDDKIMGNYQGGFTGPDWSGRLIRAQVVAQSKIAYTMVLFLGDNAENTVRTEIKGKARKGVLQFKDKMTLPAWGGSFDFSAQIQDETMTGAFAPKDQQGAQPAAFELKRVFIEPPTRGMAPPEGAVALFDGTNLDQWQRWPLGWCIQGDGSMEVCSSNLKTIAEFGSGLYHVEFMTPFMPTERGQGRGNSGVYILGNYEVQVLDTFGLEPKDNHCGGLYSLATPIADALLPPLQWQTYDITFHAAEFDAQGNKTKNARIHVLHNGIVIHNDIELSGPTPGGITEKETATGPLLLQDHGNQVRYRNIWFQPSN